MRALRSIGQGMGLALSSPKLIVLLWLATLLSALPATVVIGESIGSSIGHSLVHQELRGEMELGWLGEYRQRASGLEKSFVASTLSAAALFDNVEAWFSGELFVANPGLVAVGGLYALVWIFLLGGALDHFRVRRRILRTAQLIESGSRYFFRFVRLAAISAVAYYLVYRLSRWLFPWVERSTQDITVEGRVLLYNLLAAAGVIFGLTLIHMIFDYARIATVLEERRSMIFAALKGALFVLSHPLDALAVYYGLGLLAAVLPVVYFVVAPSLDGATLFQVLLALAIGQVFLAAKLSIRMALYGGQMALYESAIRSRSAIRSLGHE